jgi:hypothetical protein
MERFNIEWRSKEGYGDFITVLCYAHSSTIKYERPVHINFHWPNPKDYLLSEIDKESILYRFNHIVDRLKPVKGLTISHEYSSVPSYRFINELEEFNVLHGLWYPKKDFPIEKGLVVVWSSRHNLDFPGYHKDPVYDHWDKVMAKLKGEGFNVQEVTYRTPIKEVMDLMQRSEFGVGYEGMVHQLYKFLWRPIVIASQRTSLARLLAPQGTIVTKPELLLNEDILIHVNKSKQTIKRLLKEHRQYILDKQDPTKHPLYNKPV